MGKKVILDVTETPITNKFVDGNKNEVVHYKFPNGLEFQTISDGKSKAISSNYKLLVKETENEIIYTPDMSVKNNDFNSLFN